MLSISELESLYRDKKAVIGIIGLGYVGMPLAIAAWTSGFRVVGFDIDREKVDLINSGKSYLKHISSKEIAAAIDSGHLRATNRFEDARDVNAIIICVPTPLTKHREPDLTYIENTAKAIAPHIQTGQLISLESTTWPGTTIEIVKPILERGGLKSSSDFYLVFSPEREDPGNEKFSTKSIPKVVGGDDPAALRLASAMYGSIMSHIIPVSSTKVAEAVKLTENIFRAVNIALVNELKLVYDAMGIDIWEVIDAAKTKPFGFMPFYPGPGLGGHCVPIDPFYLTWKAREYELSTRFIELAGQINTSMPRHVVQKIADSLDNFSSRGLRNAKVLIIGIAYKKNVEDTRESPAVKLIELLELRGAKVDFYDPHVSHIPRIREYPNLVGRAGIKWDANTIRDYDVVVIATDHDVVDYADLVKHSKLVVDTRNVCRRKGFSGSHIVKA